MFFTSPRARGFIRAASISLMVLALLNPVLSMPQSDHSNLNKGDLLEMTIIGDSWASGVAYNLSNVYGPTDREFCYRTKEAWGVQMVEDESWNIHGAEFHFAACGGSLMQDLKKQMAENAGHSSIVWGMFGGNNAYFGAIARACIYQPYSYEHPFGWGLAWDEDPDGTGLCKQNLKKADNYLSGPQLMRRETTDALDDILIVAQDEEHRTSEFDLYVSSYVHFFDDTTDDCDNWSFAHDRVSIGRPKLVKGLRKEINDKVQRFNVVQADVIESYGIPAPKLPEHRVHNVQPDGTFDGHRFCEKNRTFEDQFYHPDLWLWNLQYNDEQSGEHAGVVMTDANNVKYMSTPEGIDETQSFATVLGTAGNPYAAIPPGDDPHTLQYGFGWTARPFHPKWEGHKALKNFFVQRMKDDNVPRPKSIEPPPPPPPPIPLKK